MRRIDITEKLSFDGKPVMVIKGEEFEINDDAVTILKLMDMIDVGGTERDLMEGAKLLFGEKGLKRLLAMKLSFRDFSTVIEHVMTIVTGEDEPGEPEKNGTAYSMTGI
ncbi:MAG: hypothetical protein U0M21_00670 [Emergencia sp.]|nr:hypothetical protein [Emergencia sp.]